MRTAFGYAWSKLYLAILAMTTSTAPLPERVASAFRQHLSSLNSQNTPPHVFERLRAVRARLAHMAEEEVEEDATLDIVPLTAAEAAAIAEELLSLYDELAKTKGRDAEAAEVRPR
jgi:hypothetical protein